ncbi:hypothetical protein CMK11_01130 [Candidatus Poribacteria bacterium]|nr:hypothetical protein [Candidatus Poribacteria bacterium]
MLVFISDLHLTDGSSGTTVGVQAFRKFRQDLSDMAYDASWRRTEGGGDAVYAPIARLDVVLLGDILDLIRSGKWAAGEDANTPTAERIRPWSSQRDVGFLQMVDDISRATLKENDDRLEVLRGISGGSITLPAAENGRPSDVGYEPTADGRVPVEVDIHYMVGNHDWFYCIDRPEYDPIRKAVVDAMGLSNAHDVPFPHDLEESTAIRVACEDHRVVARHGDIYDRFNFEEDRAASSLGDVIVVELLNKFAAAVEAALGNQLPDACIAGLSEVDNVRPITLVPVWVDGVLRDTCPSRELRDDVKDVWNDLVDEFLKVPFVRERDKRFRADDVDVLQAVLRLTQGFSFGALSGALGKLHELGFRKPKKHHEHAAEEQAITSLRARYAVYGHTHRAGITPLDVRQIPGMSVEQLYFNTGAWRRVHELVEMRPDEHEFVTYSVMTYVAFYKDDERNGRRFETWSGTLAVDPPA